MSKALLICNGETTARWLRPLIKETNFILAADGGANKALAAGIVPDAVIGDLDSVSPRTRRFLKDVPFIHVKRQDNTDLEKALDWLVKQNFTDCMIVGATGGRLDFTLGNILAALPYVTQINIEFLGPTWRLIPLVHTYRFYARKGARCSLIPLTPCQSVTLTGVKYRVTNENWDARHIGRTLSNQITAAKSEIRFSEGTMLLYIEN